MRYINQADEVYCSYRRRKVIGDVQYLTIPVKQAADAVGTWTEYHWDMKRVNSLYTIVSRSFNFKINHRSESLSWSLVHGGVISLDN